MDFGPGSIEVLILQFAQVPSVNGVGPLAAELLYIEMVCAPAYFLIGVKAYAYVSVLDFIVIAQIAHRLHDFCDACLVVSPEQRGAVGDDKVFPDVFFQFGKLFSRRYHTG